MGTPQEELDSLKKGLQALKELKAVAEEKLFQTRETFLHAKSHFRKNQSLNNRLNSAASVTRRPR
jgi:hypothetical protein